MKQSHQQRNRSLNPQDKTSTAGPKQKTEHKNKNTQQQLITGAYSHPGSSPIRIIDKALSPIYVKTIATTTV
jgi:hypothetical protein